MGKHERYLKGTFLFSITYVEKQDNKMVVIDQKIEKCKAKDFEESLMVLEREQNIKPQIEFVSEKPERFRLGVLYVLKDGKRVWTWQLNG